MAGAREFVVRRLGERGCPASTVDTARLLVSELATNALIHALTPFSVQLRHEDGTVTVEVSDIGRGDPVIQEPEDGGGHGLRIVASLAARWGVRPDHMGKTVFFDLPC